MSRKHKACETGLPLSSNVRFKEERTLYVVSGCEKARGSACDGVESRCAHAWRSKQRETARDKTQ